MFYHVRVDKILRLLDHDVGVTPPSRNYRSRIEMEVIYYHNINFFISTFVDNTYKCG